MAFQAAFFAAMVMLTIVSGPAAIGQTAESKPEQVIYRLQSAAQ